jgi:electron transport complex protein RnfG
MGDYIKTGLTLTVFALAVGILLAGVYLLTKDPIEKADLSNQLRAIQTVLTDMKTGELLVPESQIPASSQALSEMILMEDETEVLYQSPSWKGTVYSPVYSTKLKNGKNVAIVTGSAVGYGGNVKIVASFAKGENGFDLLRIEVLDYSQETPGLGAKISEDSAKRRFSDIPKEGLSHQIKVDKDTTISGLTTTEAIDKAKSEGIVYISDIMTGATITPRAVANTINTMTEYLTKEWGD